MLKYMILTAAFLLFMQVTVVEGQNYTACTVNKTNCQSGGCACQNGGQCVAPDYTSCTCDGTGYSGSHCEVALCTDIGGCGPGVCTAPNVCNCSNTGFNGTNCTTPICDFSCGNGVCNGPNSCKCNEGWASANCTLPENECARAYPPCDNRTVCTNLAPDQGGYNCSACPAPYSGGTPYVNWSIPINGTSYITGGGCTFQNTTTSSTSPVVSSTTSSTTGNTTTSSTTSSSTNSASSSTSAISSSSSSSTASQTNVTNTLTVVASNGNVIAVASLAILAVVSMF